MSNSPISGGTMNPMSPSGTRVSQIVKVPVDQEVHLVERHVEFPEIHVRKTVQPKVQLQEIIKEVVVPEPYWEDVYIEVPEVRVVESVVYVPEVKKVVVQVPRVEIHEVVKEVEKTEIVYEDEFVHIPNRIPVDKFVEVEEIEEIIKYLPKVTYIDKEIEKIVYVPQVEVEYVEEDREIPGETKIIEIPPKHHSTEVTYKEIPGKLQIVEKIVEKVVDGPIEYVRRPAAGKKMEDTVVKQRLFQLPREEITEKIVEVPVKKSKNAPKVIQEYRNVPGKIEYVDELGNLLPVDANGNPILFIDDSMLKAAGLYHGPNEAVPVPMAVHARNPSYPNNGSYIQPVPIAQKSVTPLQISNVAVPAPAFSKAPQNQPNVVSTPITMSQQFAAAQTERVLSPTNDNSPMSPSFNYCNDPTVVIIEPIRGEIIVKQMPNITVQAPPVYVVEETGLVLPEIVETLPQKVVRVMPDPNTQAVLLTTAVKHEDGTLAPFQPVFTTGPPPPNAIPLPYGMPLPPNAQYFLGDPQQLSVSQMAVPVQTLPPFYSNMPQFFYPPVANMNNDLGVSNQQ